MAGNCMDLGAILPELVLAGTAIVLVPLAGLGRGRFAMLPFLAAAAAVLASLGLTLSMLSRQPAAVFCDTYATDGLAAVFKVMILTGAFLTLLLCASYFRGRPQEAQAPVAILFSALGAVGLVSALDLGLIVLFLQMMSVPAYLLTGLVRGDRLANEAAMKLFIYAAAALAIMAYGLTFLFGLTGSLELREIGERLAHADLFWAGAAGILILTGYAFEITLVPFHFWAPDVYQGATAPVAGFISVVPKIAGIGAFLRFLLLALPAGTLSWPAIVAAAAAVTMTLGNLVALRQTSLKRLLAWSGIAQAGYVLIAVAVAGSAGSGIQAAGFYLGTYLFMNLGAFGVVALVERTRGTDVLDAFKGMGWSAPWPAAVMALSLLSLAGIPPLAGFAGKILLLKAAITGGLTWLAVVAVVNMAVALYYYVSVIAEMYLIKSGPGTPAAVGAGYQVLFGISLAGTLALGILPEPFLRLMAVAAHVVQ